MSGNFLIEGSFWLGTSIFYYELSYFIALFFGDHWSLENIEVTANFFDCYWIFWWHFFQRKSCSNSDFFVFFVRLISFGIFEKPINKILYVKSIFKQKEWQWSHLISDFFKGNQLPEHRLYCLVGNTGLPGTFSLSSLLLEQSIFVCLAVFFILTGETIDFIFKFCFFLGMIWFSTFQLFFQLSTPLKHILICLEFLSKLFVKSDCNSLFFLDFFHKRK